MIILIGESGSGKSTILNELEKKGYRKATNYTTRKKRPNDDRVKDLTFVTKEEFEKLWRGNRLLQRAEFNNEYYGITIDSLRQDVACISIVNSVKDIKEKRKEFNLEQLKINTFYIHVSPEERTRRMLKRGDSLDSIQTRIAIDKEKFIDAKEVVDYMIENNNLEETVNEIIRLDNNL